MKFVPAFLLQLVCSSSKVSPERSKKTAQAHRFSMKKSHPLSFFVLFMNVLSLGYLTGCLFQNNALPNLPVDQGQANSSPLSEKDQFLACLPEIHTLQGSDAGNIILETHHPCFKPEDIESVEYFSANLSNSGASVLSKNSTKPFRVRLRWKNGVFLFSETQFKSGVRLRSKNIAINPYDIYENKQNLSGEKPNLNCIPKVSYENKENDQFILKIFSSCIRSVDIKYVYYSLTFPESIDTVKKSGEFIQAEPPFLLVRTGFEKIDTPPFEKQYPLCNEYAGTQRIFLAHIQLKSGEYLTAAPVKIDFPKREGCPPPPDGQAGSGK